MFKVAPRYLSGVSVFLGDDITTRTTNGELVVVMGQATMGPRVPVQLDSVDGAVAIYGADNPLIKALYEFNDGYNDAGKKTALKFVTLRVGGIASALTTSYGLALETNDAYNGIEGDYYIWASNQPDLEDGSVRAGVKIWDKYKRLCYNSFTGLDAGYFTILSTPSGTGGEFDIYGLDIDENPVATPVSLLDITLQDVTSNSLTALGAIASTDTTISFAGNATAFGKSGTVKLSVQNGATTVAAYARYTDVVGTTMTLSAPVGINLSTGATISLVGSFLTLGDSQLPTAGSASYRETYELVRNGLLDIEMYTPDYIVPGGCPYNAVDTYQKLNVESPLLAQSIVASTGATHSLVVAGGASWLTTGTVDIFDGTNHDVVEYTNKVVSGTAGYQLTISQPTFSIQSIAASGTNAFKVITLTAGSDMTKLKTSGYVSVGSSVYHYNQVDITNRTITLTLQLASGDRVATATQKVLGAITISGSFQATVTNEWYTLSNRELGLGYVLEVDGGDKFTFTWSDVKKPNYHLAHFGYLFANFCNEAAVGYNTPLCGMNVDISALEADNYSRTSIKSWIGALPQYIIDLTNANNITSVTSVGSGLLGEATLNGSANFNRCYMTNAANGDYADPAFGLLMTDEGYIDGHEVIDTYNKVVDLGKYVLVGAGLLTFGNKAKGAGYIDSCGFYALGMLAGKPKAEGLSFSKVGVNSNTNVTVIVTRSLYSDLAAAGYIVLTREKGLGWVINNANSTARNNSAYFLISTTRTIKYVVESKRSILVNFIGKPVSRLLYESARTALSDSFTKDIAQGLLASIPSWDLQIVQSAQAIGKFNLTCKLNPALELTQVDIDAVIERTTI